MKVKILKPRETIFLFIFGVIIAIYSANFIISSLRAEIIYNKAASQIKPPPKSERANYYMRTAKLFSQAIALSKGNSDYYIKKGDYLFEAFEEALGDKLSIKRVDIENIYRKAVELNPTHFAYHLKLGWFYEGWNNKKAEAELNKAAQLYSKNHQVYLYLSKYYFRTKRDWEGFKNLTLSLHYNQTGPFYDKWLKIIRQVEEEIKSSSQVSLDVEKAEVVFSQSLNRPELNFEEEDFYQSRIPFKFRVYVQNPKEEVGLYEDSILSANFTKVEIKDGYSIYELNLKSLPADSNLDSFKIKTRFDSPIERIQIIRKL